MSASQQRIYLDHVPVQLKRSAQMYGAKNGMSLRDVVLNAVISYITKDEVVRTTVLQYMNPASDETTPVPSGQPE